MTQSQSDTIICALNGPAIIDNGGKWDFPLSWYTNTIYSIFIKKEAFIKI